MRSEAPGDPAFYQQHGLGPELKPEHLLLSRQAVVGVVHGGDEHVKQQDVAEEHEEGEHELSDPRRSDLLQDLELIESDDHLEKSEETFDRCWPPLPGGSCPVLG